MRMIPITDANDSHLPKFHNMKNRPRHPKKARLKSCASGNPLQMQIFKRAAPVRNQV